MEYVSFGEGVVSNHQRHKKPPLFSGESHPNGIDPRFHYRCTCRWHNLSQGWGTTPQLNWRLPTNATKCHNATKATKPSRVSRTQEGQAPMSNSNQILRGELKPMHEMQMARTPQRCSNPSLSSSNKATKAIGGTREEESKRDTKSPKI